MISATAALDEWRCTRSNEVGVFMNEERGFLSRRVVSDLIVVLQLGKAGLEYKVERLARPEVDKPGGSR
jgi:hypothetical protein